MDELVQKLSQGNHRVAASRADGRVEELKQSIDRGLVHIKFLDTQGGTELGVKLDEAASDITQGNFEQGVGQIRVAGNLTLNYVRVQCIADLDLASLEGFGHLEIL